MTAVEAPGRRLGLRPRSWTALLVLLAAVLLEVGPRIGLVDPFAVVPLSTMVERGAELVVDGEFWSHALGPSLTAIAAAFGFATVLGVLAGFVLWRVPSARGAVEPWLSVYYAIPTFALYPLLVALLGAGLLPIVLLGTLFAVVAVVSATLTGLDATPRTVLRLADALELTGVQRAVKVLLPAAFPHIAVGIRLALSYSLIGVLASEFVLSSSGLGHFISRAYNDFAFADMYAGVLFVLALATLINVAFGALSARRDRRAAS